MKTLTTTPLGSFLNWESETFRLLGNYESKVASRLPRGELTSRVFHRLSRATIRDIEHLEKLIPRIVHQVLIDYGREKSRESERFVYDYAFDFPTPTDASSDIIEKHKEMLLGVDSPLDPFEKAMIHIALEEPVRFFVGSSIHEILRQSDFQDAFPGLLSALSRPRASLVMARLQAIADLGE